MSEERQEDNKVSPWWGEHLNRYQEALKLMKGQNLNILDIACGNGFGSNFLAGYGHLVVGVDLSEEAIRSCNLKYKQNNLKFEVGDGTNLTYKAETFDVIISFETIEHTKAFNEMLKEFKRVLKRNGTILISTPNFKINSPNGIIVNPYHIQEWTYEELQKLLSDHFSSVRVLGQQYSRYKNKKELKYKAGNWIEKLLYKRGMRKLPIKIQDAIMNFLIQEPMYPLADDFNLVSEKSEIEKCKTFFAICKLK